MAPQELRMSRMLRRRPSAFRIKEPKVDELKNILGKKTTCFPFFGKGYLRMRTYQQLRSSKQKQVLSNQYLYRMMKKKKKEKKMNLKNNSVACCSMCDGDEEEAECISPLLSKLDQKKKNKSLKKKMNLKKNSVAGCSTCDSDEEEAECIAHLLSKLNQASPVLPQDEESTDEEEFGDSEDEVATQDLQSEYEDEDEDEDGPSCLDLVPKFVPSNPLFHGPYRSKGNTEVDIEKWRRYYNSIHQSDGFDITDVPGSCLQTVVLPWISFDRVPRWKEEVENFCILSITKFNQKNAGNYKFVEVEKVNRMVVAGYMLFITFRARSGNGAGPLQDFQARVWDRIPPKKPKVELCRLKCLASTGN